MNFKALEGFVNHIDDRSIMLNLEKILTLQQKDYNKKDKMRDIFEEPLFLTERITLLNLLISEMNTQKNKNALKMANISRIIKTFFDLDLSINSVNFVISHLTSKAVI